VIFMHFQGIKCMDRQELECCGQKKKDIRRWNRLNLAGG